MKTNQNLTVKGDMNPSMVLCWGQEGCMICQKPVEGQEQDGCSRVSGPQHICTTNEASLAVPFFFFTAQ